MDVKTTAIADVTSGQWAPGRFESEADRLSYAKAWDYYYTTLTRTEKQR